MSIFDMFRSRSATPAPVRVDPPVMAAETSGTAKPADWMLDVGWSGAQSRVKTLPRVTGQGSERHATVFACCNIIAGDLSKVPLQLWQENKDGSQAEVKDHPALYLMNVESSEGVPARVTRFASTYCFTLRGVDYSYAPRDGAGELMLIDHLLPDGVAVSRSGRKRFYDFTDGDEVQRRALVRSMVHMRYMALDGWQHRSPLEVAAESVGLALAGQESAARTVSGQSIRGVITMADNYESPEARTRSAARVKAALNGSADGFPVMNEGESVKTLDMSAADQELLASRKFDREMIAGIYRMPPSKLQMLEYGVKANGQQQAIDYRTDCLLHWSVLVEAQYDQGLLTAGERASGLRFRHNFDGLMQATTKEQFDASKVAVGGPFMTPNEARRRANLPERPDGNILYPPSNMTDKEPATTEKDDQE